MLHSLFIHSENYELRQTEEEEEEEAASQEEEVEEADQEGEEDFWSFAA